MKNSVGREIPEHIAGYGAVNPYGGAFANLGVVTRAPVKLVCAVPGKGKVLPDIRTALEAVGLKDGATISFHHHLRNGDHVLNAVLGEIARLGLRDITVAASSLFPVHAPLVEHIRQGVVTRIATAYMSGPVAQAVSHGMLTKPVVLQTHGGRARSIESGELHIDVAFVGAPMADAYGNINEVTGRAACGSLGYSMADVQCADRVVAIADNLVPYPACPIAISQDMVDFVVAVDSIGDPQGIVSGTTRATDDPVGLQIAQTATRVIEASGLLVDGFSFQTGAGGISLAIAAALKAHDAGAWRAGQLCVERNHRLHRRHVRFRTVLGLVRRSVFRPESGRVFQAQCNAHADVGIAVRQSAQPRRGRESAGRNDPIEPRVEHRTKRTNPRPKPRSSATTQRTIP